jgi:hypothetical protein
MKYISNLFIGLTLLATSAFGATTIYTVTTGATATSNGIANSSGLQFQNNSVPAFVSAGPGTVAFGYFSIDDTAITNATSAATLTSSFNNWNTSGTSTFNSPGPTQQRGVFSITAAARDLTLPANSAFNLKNMYVFVGNSTSYATSTEFLVLKLSHLFNSSESGPTAFSKSVNASTATLLFGTSSLDVRTTSADGSATPGWRTAAPIPETSTSLLGAIGALALLRRRRN